MSILVGSADASGGPACCRGIALVPAPDLATATVYVPAATSRDVLANAATTKRLAVVASHPIDHTSVQLKGTVQNIRLAREDEAPLVRGRLGEFVNVLDRIGVPRPLASSMSCWPAFALEIRVEELYDQTPGPKAGTAIR